MPSKYRKALILASLTFAVVATLVPAVSAQAGPISDMLARHRQQRSMKLPPMEKPFSMAPHRNPNAPSLTQRFKQRFSLKRGSSSFSSPLNHDSGVIRTSK